MLRSTDQGATWTQSTDEIYVAAAGFEGGVSETAIDQRDDDRIYVYARQQVRDAFHFVTSYSDDDGITWSTPADSDVLATNTFPEITRSSSGSRVMTWPGHNGYGQGSYWRNNITIAWKPEDDSPWLGHQDVVASSSLSEPGWSPISGHNDTFIEVHSVLAGDNRSFIGYHRPSGKMAEILIEDIDGFLEASHGAGDAIRYRNESGADLGTELAYSRWWRTTRHGELALLPSPRHGLRRVHVRSTRSDSPTGASRMFPGIRRGRVQFDFRYQDLTSGLRVCLQEGFSADSNARGTVLALDLDSSGQVRVTEDGGASYYSMAPDVAVREHDPNPATGDLEGFGQWGPVALDYKQRSMGIDLRVARTITSLQLTHDRRVTNNPATRVVASELELWTSDTNNGDWVKLTSWTASSATDPDGTVITVSGSAITTRYLKIVHPYNDASATWAARQQDMIRVFPEQPSVDDPRTFHALNTPITLSANDWHRFILDVDLDASSDGISIAIDGLQRDVIDVLHPAATVTHLLMLTRSGSMALDLDGVIVQDLSLGLPALDVVGSSESV